MFFVFLRIVFVFVFTGAAFLVSAQSIAPDLGNPKAENDDIPKNVKETLAKSRIEKEKKDYEELLESGDEALKISEQLEQSFAANNKFSAEDKKKLERFEKLVKKIRRELRSEGGDDESDSAENPADTKTMLKNMIDKTATLVAELKKASRYSVSVIAFENSNALLRTVRLLRFNKN